MAKKSLLADITGVFSSNILAIVLALAVSVVLSRQLGPEGFGIYNAILVVPLLVVSLSQLGMRASAIYHIGSKRFDRDAIVSNILIILFITSFLGILISGVTFLLMKEVTYTLIMCSIVLLIIPAGLTGLYCGGVFLGREQIRRANFIRWFPVFLNLIFVIIFIWVLSYRITAALFSLMIAEVVTAIWALWIIKKEYTLKLKPDPLILKNLARMGILYALSFFIIQLNYRIDVIILTKLSTLSEVGYYSLGVSIAEKLWQLPLAIGIVVMSRTANTEDQELISVSTAKLLRVSILVSLLSALVMFFIAPFVVPAIWGKDFMPSVILLQYILPGILFLSIYRILSSRLSGIGLPQISIYVFSPALVINILLNIWWIPLYGAMGAVMATNASYTLGSIAFLIVYAKVVHMPLKKIFNFQKSDFNFISRLMKRVS